MKRAALLLGTVMLTGCSTLDARMDRMSGEKLDIFAEAPEAPDTWAAANVAGTAPTGDWLGQFNDDVMDALVAEALSANPTIESRAAAVRASRAQARIAGVNLKPRVDGSVSAGVTSNTFEIAGNTERSTDPTYGLGLDASWEIDLWNRIGTGVDAAEADLAASEADLAGTQLSIASQTAIGWINLNAALAQERVAVQTFEARSRVKNLTERRFSSGLSTALDVRTARSALAGAEATIALRRQQSKEAARRLEILLGRYPSAELDAPAEIAALDPIEPMSSPILLLSRRPDIAASEARVVAAGLRAEQARLAMLPSIRLTGSLSTTADDLADAFDPTLIAARLIANLTQPLLDGGLRDAQRDAAVANAEGAVANYASTVLTAWREVEDALAADALLAQQEDAQALALEEALLAEELAERQYSNGLVSVFNLIDSQTRRLNAESQLVSARANRAINRVTYHIALGGGLPGDTSSTATAGLETAETGDRS